MSSISDIKSRINNIEQTRKITKAMYLISSIKLNRVKKQVKETKYFFDKINETLYDIAMKSPYINSMYIDKNSKITGGKKAYLVFIGDNGLAGNYNYNTIKAVEKYVTDRENSVLMVVGYMGKNTIKNMKYNIDEGFNYFVHNPTLLRAKEMTDKLIQMYVTAKVDEIYIIYNDMISSFKHETKLVKILPINIDVLKQNVSARNEKYNIEQIKYEPSVHQVFDSLIPLYLKGSIYGLLVDAYACEQSSRIFAMDSATKNATKIIRKLRGSYNKERQYRITKELNELISGMDI